MMLDYHRRLIDDEPRTIAFRDAIRSVVTPDSVVLDLGSGTGILAFFAYQAGARRVYAIDDGHIADVISLLSQRHGFTDRLQVFHAHSSKVELPEKATVLVTETLGAFGLDEQILSSVIDARKRLLAPDAVIIPRDVTMIVAPIQAAEQYDLRVSCWGERYGFDFSLIRPFATNFLQPHRAVPDTFLAPPGNVISVDVTRATSTEASGTAQFRTSRAGTLHGFAGWFDSWLTPDIKVTGYGTTSWNQVFLPLPEPVALPEGAPISVTVETDDGGWFRWRGTANGTAFDQVTTASSPRCTLQSAG